MFCTLAVLLPIVICQVTDAPWSISYSKYRLIYSANLPSNATGYYIYINIPQDFYVNYISFFASKGIHVSLFETNFWPRLYYYNQISEEQIQIPCREYGTSADEGIPFCLYTNFTTLNINGYSVKVPLTLIVYYNNQTITPGVHYFILYFPYVYWEDWETEYKGKSIAKGQCFNNGWCLVEMDRSRTYILSGGYDPTPRKTITTTIDADISNPGVIYKELNIRLEGVNKPIILEYNHKGCYTSYLLRGDTICLSFLLKNSTTQAICYSMGQKDYPISAGIIPSNISVCYRVWLSYSEVWKMERRNVVEDLSRYCGILPDDIVELKGLYISTGEYCANIDNIKLIIPFI